MKSRNRVAFFNILSTVLLRGISIFTAPLFSRLLGDEGYGVVSIYMVWVSVLQIFFTFQTYSTLVNARIEYPEDRQKQYQSAVMSLSLIAYLCFSAVVLLLIEPVSWVMGLDKRIIGLLLLHGFGGFSVLFINTKFTYEFKAGRNCLVSVLVPVTSLVLSLVLIFTAPFRPEYSRILALSATNGLIGIGFCIYILAAGRCFYSREFWRFCLTLSLPLIFYNLSDLVLGQSDRIMLQKMLSEGAVGQYALASSFGTILFTIFGALNNSWCPFFFEDMKQGRQDSIRSMAKNFLELFTVLSLGFILLGREVYHVFAPREFWSGTEMIPFFAASYFFNFLCTFPVNFEYYHKNTRTVAVITIAASLTNILLNYLLIMLVGMSGAAIATALSHGLQLTMHHLYCRHRLGKQGYPFPMKLWAGYLAAFLAGVGIVLLTPGVWWLRWGMGAMLGIWELHRIAKRRSLF
ncbi:MAG: oligosaccharide flippase family protein [Oscillospiraceae bacterium]|nr:oligosaccharide flippase family protein [Oscillospiraceae bacterium]